MLASVAEHERLIDGGACDIIQPDAPRVGGITQFMRLETKDGRMLIPDRPGPGITISDQARAWAVDSAEFGRI